MSPACSPGHGAPARELPEIPCGPRRAAVRRTCSSIRSNYWNVSPQSRLGRAPTWCSTTACSGLARGGGRARSQGRRERPGEIDPEAPHGCRRSGHDHAPDAHGSRAAPVLTGRGKLGRPARHHFAAAGTREVTMMSGRRPRATPLRAAARLGDKGAMPSSAMAKSLARSTSAKGRESRAANGGRTPFV